MMIDQVARAMAIYQFGSPDSWEDQIPMARAAIEAMREPSDAVWLVGINARESSEGISVLEIWDAMIDAALGKP